MWNKLSKFFLNYSPAAYALGLSGLIALDQVSKFYLQHQAQYNPSIGLSGLLPWGTVQLWQTRVMASAVAVGAVYFGHWIWRCVPKKTPWFWSAWLFHALWLAGASSNLFDRLLYGAVRDPLTGPFIPVAWNLADLWIVLAMLGTIVWIWKWESSHHKNQNL